jgi:hypothetical protein
MAAGMSHERKNGRHRYSVRYAFSNRSDDIKRRKASVAALDGFVGPKS